MDPGVVHAMKAIDTPAPRRAARRIALGVSFLSVACILLAAAPAFAQCSLCRDAAASAPAETREAMNYAILGLAFTPYGVVALAAWFLSPALRAALRVRLRGRVAGKEGDVS